MTLQEIAVAELIKTGSSPEAAKEFAKDLLIGFPLKIANLYAQQKWKEGCAAQRLACAETPKLKKLSSTVEMVKAIQYEVLEVSVFPEFKD